MTEQPTLCFVCEQSVESLIIHYNTKINLPVCDTCHGTDQENYKINELLEGLAEGFICGCI